MYGDIPRREMLPLVPRSAQRVLDVGCAGGGFGAALSDERDLTHLAGIEADEGAAGRAMAGPYDEVVVGTFPDVLPTSAYFDCVVFNDVLEHMVWPEQALGAAQKLLAPGGVIVCSVPNVRYLPNLFELLVLRDWRYRNSGILDRTHLRFYTFRSLERFLAENGWRLRSIQGVNGVLGRRVPRPVRSALMRVEDSLPEMLFAQIAVVACPPVESDPNTLSAPAP